MAYLFIIIFAFLLSFLLVPICRILAIKFQILDQPNSRKLHREPVPYLGGLAIYFGFVLTIVLSVLVYRIIPTQQGIVLLVASTFIAMMGLYDDLKGSRPLLKFLIQLVVAAFLVSQGFCLIDFTEPFTGNKIDLGIYGYIFSIMWLVGISNAVNLLDGMDGLAGGVSVISLGFLFSFSLFGGNLALAALSAGLLASITGFLWYNLPPARIYMGDTGSLMIGLLLGAFTFMAESRGPAAITVLIPIILLLLPITDTILAIFRRLRNKMPLFSPDKEHLHHRLLRLSGSVPRALIILYSINFFLGIMASLAFYLPPDYRFLLAFFLMYNLVLGLYVLQLQESRKEWRSKAQKLGL